MNSLRQRGREVAVDRERGAMRNQGKRGVEDSVRITNNDTYRQAHVVTQLRSRILTIETKFQRLNVPEKSHESGVPFNERIKLDGKRSRKLP